MAEQLYIETFGIPRPGAGATVRIQSDPGSGYSIIWVNCPHQENIIHQWIDRRVEAELICESNGWQVINHNKIAKQ